MESLAVQRSSVKPTCDLGRQQRNLKIHVAKKKRDNHCCDQCAVATGAQFSFHADICYKTNFEFAPIQLLLQQTTAPQTHMKNDDIKAVILALSDDSPYPAEIPAQQEQPVP